MASGSVTRRFLFSTSFLSLEHLWDMDTLVKAQARDMSFTDTQRRPYHHTASMSSLEDRADVVGGCSLPA